MWPLSVHLRFVRAGLASALVLFLASASVALAQSSGDSESSTSSKSSGDTPGSGLGSADPGTKSPREKTVLDKVFGFDQLRSSFSIGLTETFTDNVDLDPPGEEDAAILSDVNVGITLRRRTARITSDWDALFTLRYQTAGDDEGFYILPTISGSSNIEAIDQLLFVDFSSSVSSELLDRRDSDSESNRDIVQTTRLSPYLVHRFGSFASSELRYSLSHVSSDDSSLTHTVSYDLNSGPDFSRLKWSATASASETDSSDEGDISRRNVFLNGEYAIVRGYSLLGGIGYENFEEDGPPTETTNFEGITWRAGFRWRPHRRLDWEITYGHIDDNDSVDTNLTYNIGARTKLTLSYNESLTTGDERLIQDLSLIGADPNTGELIDLRTGLPFDPNNVPTSLEDEVTRNKTFRVALTATRGRNIFNLSTVIFQQKEVDTSVPDDEEGYSFSGSWERRISRKTNLLLGGSYRKTEFTVDGREDKNYSVTTRFDYRLFRELTIFASYDYRQNDSTDTSEEYRENRVFVGFRRSF